MNIIICDDEEIFCNKIAKLVKKYFSEMNLTYHIDIFYSGEELLDEKNKLCNCDIFFLDVYLKEMNGIEVARDIRKDNQDACILFVTGYLYYSTEGYKVNALRYIVKDIDKMEDAVNEGISAAILKLKDENKKYRFKSNNESISVRLVEIIFVSSCLYKTMFCLKDNKNFILYNKLDEIEEILCSKYICRIHKSYLVNMKYILEFGRNEVRMVNGKILPVSRGRYNNAFKKYMEYKNELI